MRIRQASGRETLFGTIRWKHLEGEGGTLYQTDAIGLMIDLVAPRICLGFTCRHELSPQPVANTSASWKQLAESKILPSRRAKASGFFLGSRPLLSKPVLVREANAGLCASATPPTRGLYIGLVSACELTNTTTGDSLLIVGPTDGQGLEHTFAFKGVP